MSLWEAQMLHAKGRLVLDRSFDGWIRDAASVVETLPIDVEVVCEAAALPASFQGDPTDRLIVATARAHRIPLATHDKSVRRSRAADLWKVPA